MEKPKHTLGPWHYEPENKSMEGHRAIRQGTEQNKGTYIAYVEAWRISDHATRKEATANTKLIAASPELFKICQNTLSWFENHRALLGNTDLLNQLRIIITKITS